MRLSKSTINIMVGCGIADAERAWKEWILLAEREHPPFLTIEAKYDVDVDEINLELVWQKPWAL
jgi:hypothetical protein